MEDYDRLIIINFLEAYYSAFQNHLETKFEIDGNEAEFIIEKLREEKSP